VKLILHETQINFTELLKEAHYTKINWKMKERSHIKFQILVIWIVVPCSEDGGSKLLRNVSILPHHYTMKMEAANFSETLVSCHIITP
jgi:hypothetical protein